MGELIERNAVPLNKRFLLGTMLLSWEIRELGFSVRIIKSTLSY